MTTQDLTFVANALLELCGCREHVADLPPIRITRDLEDQQIYQALLRGRGHDSLLEKECKEIYDLAKLTQKQSLVLEMRLSGLTFEEIGKRRGHSKQGAQHIFLQAIKKISRSLHVYPYTGLSDVYRIETRRGLV